MTQGSVDIPDGYVKGGKVTLVEGKYTVAEYSFTEFASLEDMRQYLDKQKKDDAQ